MNATIDTVRTDAESVERSGSWTAPDVEEQPSASAADEQPSASAMAETPDRDVVETPPAAWLVGDGPVDVSDVSPSRVTTYARRADGAVHFERKGGRTYLISA